MRDISKMIVIWLVCMVPWAYTHFMIDMIDPLGFVDALVFGGSFIMGGFISVICVKG